MPRHLFGWARVVEPARDSATRTLHRALDALQIEAPADPPGNTRCSNLAHQRDEDNRDEREMPQRREIASEQKNWLVRDGEAHALDKKPREDEEIERFRWQPGEPVLQSTHAAASES